MPTNDKLYAVVCFTCGTINYYTEDDPLGKRAKARANKGMLDALPIPSSECEDCKQQKEFDAQDWCELM